MRSSRTWLRLKQRSALRGGFGASPRPCAAAAAAGCSAAPLGDALAGGDAAPDGVAEGADHQAYTSHGIHQHSSRIADA